MRSFEENETIGTVEKITSYIEMTESISKNEDLLLLSYMQPHKAAHVDTIRQWITMIMSVSDIDTYKFKPHSTTAAATSKAKERHVPIETIMRAAMWLSTSTFAKFYKKIEESGETCLRDIL